MNLDELKYDRLSEPERFLLDKLNWLIEFKHGDYPDIIFYHYDTKVLFEYNLKKQSLWYSYSDIVVVFRDNFGLNYRETRFLVKCIMEGYFKWKVKKIINHI